MGIVLQSPQDAVIPFQILGGEAQVVQVLLMTSETYIFLAFIPCAYICNLFIFLIIGFCVLR